MMGLGLLDFMAERVGFEPTVDLHPRLISSQVHSTTLPPLRRVQLCGSIAGVADATPLVKGVILAETGPQAATLERPMLR